MGKRREPDKPIVKDDPSRILDTTMEDVMHNSMMPYAEHVILERALPRVEDGLKPVQRRILYTMMELGVTPDKPHRKCARIVGDCLGKYHPHGDSSVYGALVHMAQDFSMRGTMVDGHGNFGSIDGDSAAAMRYTEARMAPLAMQMLRDIEKDTVPFRLNFDDTLKEPDMLPARFPNLLVNGANGIAVGLATNIPPHNLKESIQAVIAQIDDPEISLDGLMKVMPCPDFPTGGVLVDNDEIRQGYATGRGKLTLRARVHVEDGSAGRKLLVITEVPYQINKAAMLEKILKLSEEKKAALGGIYDIRDESDRTGMRAVVELKKDTDPQKVLAYLYKYSDLQVTFGVNMVAIADGKPVLMSLKSMITYFINHQKNVVTRRTTYELKQAQARAHVLEGLMIAMDNLDEVIALIRASKSPKEAKNGLMERFGLTEIQAQAILDMRLQRLTNLEIEALRKEFADLLKLIKKLEGILGSEKKLMAVIRNELQEIAEEYGDERRTTLEKAEPIHEVILNQAPEPEEAVIVYTENGYLKRLAPAAFRKSQESDQPAEENESLKWQLETMTDENLYIFTDHCNCYPVPVGSLNECRPKDRGQQLTGILAGLEDEEKPLHMFCQKPAKLKEMPDLLFVTAQGMVKRSNMAEYDVRSKKYVATALKKDDQLLHVLPDLGGDLLLMTRGGMTIRFHAEEIPVQGRVATGVRGMQTEEDDPVAWCFQVTDQSELLLFSDRGYGKRLPQIEFEPQNRGGKGVRAMPFNRTGTTGRTIGGAALAGAEECIVVVRQASSPATVMNKSEILLKTKADKGFPYIMAIMDDVVTDVRIQATRGANDDPT